MPPVDSSVGDLDVELTVSNRYSAASQSCETALCCAVKYDQKYLEVLPADLIERDYGCGDPTRHVREGETVLDLGSGGGKVCYIASQIVGRDGQVIGVDMNDDMLELARKHRDEIGRRIGWHNVEFRKGRIQDLALDLDEFERFLREHPVTTTAEWLSAQRHADMLRQRSPLIATDSIDIVLSNCVLNLVHPRDRQQLFAEVFRVLRPGGRAVISDIVSSACVPAHLRNDPKLWSGCVSGAFEEMAFVEAFEAAGFIGLRIIDREQAPWLVLEEIEFRSVTVQAFKPVTAASEANAAAVIYRGPWKRVFDDQGHELRRGVRTSVGNNTFAQLTREPFADQMIAIGSADKPVQAAGLVVFDQNCCGGATNCHDKST